MESRYAQIVRGTDIFNQRRTCLVIFCDSLPIVDKKHFEHLRHIQLHLRLSTVFVLPHKRTSQQPERHDMGGPELPKGETSHIRHRIRNRSIPAHPLYARDECPKKTHLFPAPLRSPPVFPPTPSRPRPSSATRTTGPTPPCTFLAPCRGRGRCLGRLTRERLLERDVGLVKLEETRYRDPLVPSIEKGG